MNNHPGSGPVEGAGPSAGEVTNVDQGLLELFGTVADAVLVLDAESTIQFAGPGVNALLGYTPARIVGESFTETLLSEEVVDTSLAADETDDHSIDGWTAYETTVESIDETVIPVEISTVAVETRSAIVCLLEDVRDRKQREREQKRYEDLFNAVGDPLYVLDEDGQIDEINDAMVEYTGYGRVELLGRAIDELLPAEDHTDVRVRLREQDSGRTHTTESFETPLVTRDGTLKLSEINETALTDGRGEYAGSIGVLRDIRERKRHERDLELLKTVLTRVLRHNVRNELNTVWGHADIIDDAVDEELEKHTETILEATERLLDHSEKARLIEQVVESTELKETDLTTTVERIVADVKKEQPHAIIETEMPESATVAAHPRISAAIEELVDNAVRHTPHSSSPEVSLWTDEQPQFVTLFVEDEAGGLDATELEVLREGMEEDLKHSSGVGLWLVRWLVEYSEADLIAHRTDEGTLMGIRFLRPDHPKDALPTRGHTDTPFARTPAHVVSEPSFREIHGEAIVGRMDELHELEDVYTAVERKGGHIVFVGGASGMGKTTLVEEFHERISEDETEPVVARGVCGPDETPPYHAIEQVLEAIPTSTDLHGMLADMSAFTDDAPETVDQRKQTLFVDIATELRNVATDQPLVLVFEDLHRANRATTELLEFLLDEVGQWAYPILFVCTYLTDELEGDNHAVELAQRVENAGRGRRLELEPLSVADVRNLLEHLQNGTEIPQSVAEYVHDHTGGNPLFVSELGRYLPELLKRERPESTRPAAFDEAEVPVSLERAVQERLETVSPSVRQTLELGAVVGEWFSIELLRESSAISETELLEHIDALVQSRFWERADGTLGFVHELLREQTLEKLEEDRKVTLHTTVAEAIERIHEDDAEQYGRLANHYERAGNYRTALEYYRQAGTQANRTYAHETALTQYERALSLAREYALLDDAEMASLLAAIAEIHHRTGTFDSAVETTDTALDLASDKSPEQCRLFGIRAMAQFSQSEYEKARASTRRQREVARTIGTPKFEAEAAARLGEIAKEQGEYDEAQTHYREGLALAEDIGDSHREATNRHGLGMVAWRQGKDDTAQVHFEESLEIAREIGDKQLEAGNLSNLGIVFQYQGAYDSAHTYYDQSLEIAQEIGDRQREAANQNNLGIISEHQGNYEQARERYEESLTIKRDIGDRQGLARGLNNLGEVLRYQGRYETARQHYEDSLEIHRDLDNRQGETVSLINLGEIARTCGSLKEAREYYESGLDLATEIQSPRLQAHALLGLARVTRRQAEEELARETDALSTPHQSHERSSDYLDRSRELFEETDDRSGVAKTRLEAARAALLWSDTDEARDLATRAQASFTELGDDRQRGCTRRLLGRIETRAGNHADARRHLRAALETFEELDAVDDALETVKQLLELARVVEATDRYERLAHRAQQLATDASDVVVANHREWLEQY